MTTSVEVGAVYRASVNGKKIEVRVERETWKGDKHTGWGGINLATNRPTVIKTGTKMTRIEEPAAPAPAPGSPAPGTPGTVAPAGGKRAKAPKAAAPEPAATAANVANDAGSGGGGKPGGGEDPGGQLTEGKPHRQNPHQPKPSAGKNAKRNRDGARAPRTPRTPQAPRTPRVPRKPGILALAAEVLAKSKEPMTCAAIVEKVLASKQWVTAGKTPAATLYAAIIRDIRAKGKESRFTKTDRGLFAAAAPAGGKGR